MFTKRKLSVMAAVSLLSMTLLAGCSSTKEEEKSEEGQGTTESKGAATSKEVLANKNARAAIAMAIDKQAIVDVILNNGSIVKDTYTAKGLASDNGKDYVELTEGMGYGYNEEEAIALWNKAKEEVGFDTVEIEILTFDSEGGKKTGEFIQAELGDLEGLTATVKNLPFEQKLALESAGQFDIAFSGWGPDYPDPLTFLDTMTTGSQYAKQVGYESAEFDKLIDEASTLPTTEAYDKYAQAEDLMLTDGYLAPLYQAGASYLEKDYVSGIARNTWGADFTYTYASVEKDDKTLNITTTSDIPTLDVSKATDQESFQAMNSAMEGLTRVDDEGVVHPGMATEWTPSEDFLTWTFKLREDAKWSNGDAVTAKDFEYSWNRTLDPATASEYTYIMEDIESFKAVDDYTFEVKLNRPVAYFAELMSFQIFLPQNQAFVESCGESYGTSVETQVYNGPFTLASWTMEDQHQLVKNPDYWDAANVKLEKINTKVVKDVSSAVNLYESGEIDKVGLSADFVDKYKDSPEFKTAEDGSVYMLQINGGNNNKE